MNLRQKIPRKVCLDAKSPIKRDRKAQRKGTPFVDLQKGGNHRSPNLRNICVNNTSTRKQIQFHEYDESTRRANFNSMKSNPCDMTKNLPKSYSLFAKPITNNEIANSTFQDLSINKENLGQAEGLNQNSQGSQVSFEELCAPEVLRDEEDRNDSLPRPQLSTISEHPFEHIVPTILTNSSCDLNAINFCPSSSRDIGMQTETFRKESTLKKNRNNAKNSQGILRNNNVRKNRRPTFQGKRTHIKIYAQEVYIENYINKS